MQGQQTNTGSNHNSGKKSFDPNNAQPFYPKKKLHNQGYIQPTFQHQSVNFQNQPSYHNNGGKSVSQTGAQIMPNQFNQKPLMQNRDGMIQPNLMAGYQQYNQLFAQQQQVHGTSRGGYRPQSGNNFQNQERRSDNFRQGKRGGYNKRGGYQMVEIGDPQVQEDLMIESKKQQESIEKVIIKAQDNSIMLNIEVFLKVYKKLEAYLELQLKVQHEPLQSNLEFQNHSRRLSGWILLYLEESWSFYNRAKTLFPFEGKIFNQLAVISAKENDYLASIYYFMFQSILYTRIGIDELEQLEPEVHRLLNEYFLQIDRESNKSDDINKIIHLSIVMIFIAHATIADSIKDIQKQKLKKMSQKSTDEEDDSSQESELEKALGHQLPKYALLQLQQLLMLIVDRISQLPSPWIESLTPILTWLTLHKEDDLLVAFFDINPQIEQDLSRIHKLLSNYVYQEMKLIRDEDDQLKLTQMIGNTLLNEETFFIGFLPLQSYVDNKKQIGQGVKCPPEKENLIRSLILKDNLEMLRCTFEDKKQSNNNSPIKESMDPEELKESEQFFEQIDKLAINSQKLDQKPLIIVDAQNAAMRHGGGKLFSVKGIQIVIEFWHKNGHQVVCFLPDYLLNYDQINIKKKLAQMNIKEAKVSQIPDNISLLHALSDKGFIIKTPPQDYDDSYCIKYAKKFNAFIVTNDKFRDYITKQVSSDQARERKWIKDHSVSYAFNVNEFLPNPDSKIFNRYEYDDYKHYPLEEM
eukprot:403363909